MVSPYVQLMIIQLIIFNNITVTYINDKLLK